MTRQSRKITTALSLAGLLAAQTCNAEQLPLWELGAGLATINSPDYRGSDVNTTRIFPIPYFIYRGSFLKADRDGLRSTLFDSDKAEVSFSLNATLPIGRDNATRRSEAERKATVAFGPSVNVDLWNSQDKKTALVFRAPVRTGFTLEAKPKTIGWTFSPGLDLHLRDVAGAAGWNFGLFSGVIFSDRKYNARFYSISPQEATASLPQYAAAGGYSGAQATMSLSKRFRNYWVGSFVRYDTVAGAVFEDSPLVRKRGGASAGLAFSWVFSQSSTMVGSENPVFHEVK